MIGPHLTNRRQRTFPALRMRTRPCVSVERVDEVDTAHIQVSPMGEWTKSRRWGSVQTPIPQGSAPGSIAGQSIYRPVHTGAERARRPVVCRPFSLFSHWTLSSFLALEGEATLSPWL